MRNFTLFIFFLTMSITAFGQNHLPTEKFLHRQSDIKSLKEQLKQSPEEITRVKASMDRNFKSVSEYGNPPAWSSMLHFGGSGSDYGFDVITDDNGNIYACGSFNGTMQYEDHTWNSTGHRDGWLAKYQADGTLIWLKQIQASANNYVEIYGINTDVEGNILITGYHTGNIYLDEIQLISVAELNMFFASLDTDGNTLMAKNYGSNNYLHVGFAIDSDEENNIYITGTTDGIIDYMASSIIQKYDNSGTLLYSEYSEENFIDMKIKGQNIYFAGTVHDEGYIGDFYLDPVSYNDAFIAQANLDMDFQWVLMANHAEESGTSYAMALDVDDQENIYLTGNCRHNIGFGDYFFPSHSDGFVVKTDASGEISWLSRITGSYNSSKTLSVGIDNLLVTALGKLITFDMYSGYVQSEIYYDQRFENSTFNTQNTEYLIIGSESEKICMHAFSINLNTQWIIQHEGDAAKSYVINARGDKYGNTFALNSTKNKIDYHGVSVESGLFLAKQNSAGEVLWLHNFPDVFMMPELGSFLEIDTTNGFVYITGYFEEYFIIPGIETLIAGDEGSIFILKYDFEGNYQWATQMDFDSYDLSIAPSKSGNLYIGGLFNGTVIIGNETLVSHGYEDCFIAKFSPDGSFEWAQGFGGTTGSDYMCLITVNENDEVYFTGECTSSEIYFDDYQLNLEDGDGNIVFAKFDGNGNLQWATSKAGSQISSGWGDNSCWPTGIASDADGNVFIKGGHGDSTYFDNILLRSPYSYFSKFIAGFDPDGNTLWAKSINESHFGWDYNQMSIDEAGNAYIGMSLRDTIYFEDVYMHPCWECNDLLVAKYDADGMLDWARFIQGNINTYSRISSVSALSNDYVMCTGYFTGMLELGGESMMANNTHGFMVSLGESTGVPENEDVLNIPLVKIFPNPASSEVNIQLPYSDDFNLTLKDNAGRNVIDKNYYTGDQLNLDVSGLPGGVYYLLIETNDSTEIKKLVLE